MNRREFLKALGAVPLVAGGAKFVAGEEGPTSSAAPHPDLPGGLVPIPDLFAFRTPTGGIVPADGRFWIGEQGDEKVITFGDFSERYRYTARPLELREFGL